MQVKYSPVAVSIYQILNIISRIETDERKPTPQQANVTMEKIEASIRKIIETLRNSMGVSTLGHDGRRNTVVAVMYALT